MPFITNGLRLQEKCNNISWGLALRRFCDGSEPDSSQTDGLNGWKLRSMVLMGLWLGCFAMNLNQVHHKPHWPHKKKHHWATMFQGPLISDESDPGSSLILAFSAWNRNLQLPLPHRGTKCASRARFPDESYQGSSLFKWAWTPKVWWWIHSLEPLVLRWLVMPTNCQLARRTQLWTLRLVDKK